MSERCPLCDSGRRIVAYQTYYVIDGCENPDCRLPATYWPKISAMKRDHESMEVLRQEHFDVMWENGWDVSPSDSFDDLVSRYADPAEAILAARDTKEKQ